MPFPVVKVRKDEFEKFLRDSDDIATNWKPDNMEFEQFVSSLPCTVDELMSAIDSFAGQESDYVYIFNSNLDDPDGEWNRVDYDEQKLPEVTSGELKDYRVHSMGKDFLYFACSLEEAACVKYTTLLPGRTLDDAKEEEDVD